MLRVALFGCLLVLCACGVSYPRPQFPHQDARELLRSFDSLRARVHSIRAEARVDQRGQGGRIRGTVMMFIERPNHVRFDVMTQFGPAAVMTSDGRQFTLLDLRERRFLSGQTCPENLALLLGIALSDADIEHVLLGGTPVLENATSTLTLRSDGQYRIHLTGADGRTQDIDFFIREADVALPPSEQRLRVSHSEMFDAQGSTLWRIAYEDYDVRPLGEMGVAFPRVVSFFDPVRDHDVRARFVNVDLNVEVPADAFHQSAPPGVSEEVARCTEQVPAAQ